MECAVTSAVGKNKRLLVVCNGVYGERMAMIADVHGIACSTVKLEWGEELLADSLEKAMETEKIAAVAVVHHETTTGVMNDIFGSGTEMELHFIEGLGTWFGVDIALSAHNLGDSKDRQKNIDYTGLNRPVELGIYSVTAAFYATG